MNTENDEDKKLQDAYLEYYNGQSRKAIIIGSCWIFIPLLFYSTLLLLQIIPEELHYIQLAIFIAGGVFSVAGFLYWTYTQFKRLYSTVIMPIYFSVSVILLAISLFFKVNGYIFIILSLIYFFAPSVLGVAYIVNESNSSKYAKKIAENLTLHKPEDHTAIIFPHDENKKMDGGDEPVMALIDALKKYNENFQIYLCLYEEDMINVLTNPYVKRIWIFGHGDRGGCVLTDKYFSYADFMTEKTDSGWKIRDIEPKEYVYQCHCNPKSTTPLTDYLLKEKGRLNPNVDDMPNYYDSGITDMKTDKAKRGKKHSFKVKLCNKLGNMLHEDNKYNDNSSIEYFIKRYAEHLEKKREYMEKTHKNSTVEQ